MVVVKRGQEEGARRAERERVRMSWKRFPSLVKFLQDYVTVDWERIQECGLHFKQPKQCDGWPGLVKIDAFYCHRLPWCINCVARERWRRVQNALDAIEECTPAGKQPRMMHIVQTAPTGEGAASWGFQASQDVPKFRHVMWKQLVEYFGEGAGAIISYHDIGERGFAKRHPHLDLTLNGWTLVDGKPVLTPVVELVGPSGKTGFDKWQRSFAEKATVFRLDATPGNPQFSHPIEGRAAYHPVLKYQMRELVDLRKIEYSRDTRTLYWKSYKDNTRQKFTVTEFCAGIAEYRYRLKQWPDKRLDEEGQSLHVGHGHLAKSAHRRAMRAVGGRRVTHRPGCKCASCNDWYTPLDDEDAPDE